MIEHRIAALCGTFDVGNFGDLLFPIVASARLAPHGWTVIPVSPTSGKTAFADALATRTMSDLLSQDLSADAVLIGGGELVHAWAGDFLSEYRVGGLSQHAYLSLWYGASVAAALADAPLVWNAPGVPAPFDGPLRRRALDPAVAAADYVAVRDQTSAIFLGRVHQAAVVPDTVASIARVWPKAMLAVSYRNLLQRLALDGSARTMAVHLRPDRTNRAEIAQIGAAVDAFASCHGLVPILVAIGPSLNDGEGARALSRSLTVPHVVLDTPRSLQEIAALLAHAVIYLGHSMHGYVTAAAYDVPGVIIARSGFRKYQGFAHHIGRAEDVVRSWDRAFLRASALMATEQGELIPASVHQALDRHWMYVATAIADRAVGTTRRAMFLRHVLAGGLRGAGFCWIAGTLPIRGPSDVSLIA